MATADFYAALDALVNKPKGTGGGGTLPPPTTVPQPSGKKYYPAADKPYTPPAAASVDNGTDIGDVFSTIGSGLGWALDKATIPMHAVGSFAKELNDEWASSDAARWLGTGGNVPDWLITQRTPEEYTQHLKDIGAQGGFETKDLGQQISDRKGMGDYITQIRPNSNIWYRRGFGLVGDFATDPLMRVAPGVENLAGKAGTRVAETAAQQASYEGLDAAIKSASSKSITDALINAAKESGFAIKDGGGFVDDALNKLLIETRKRGVGALTPSALAKAGISAETAAKLGVGRLGRTVFHGAFSIPGMSATVNVTEGLKGVVKAGFKVRPASKFLYGKFGNSVSGGFRKVMFDEGAKVSARVGAIMAEQARQEPNRIAARWGKLTQKRIQSNWSGAVRDAEGTVDKAATKAAKKAGAQSWMTAPENVAVDATHSVEAGGTGVLEEQFRVEHRQIFQDMQAAGVDIGDLGPNQVPHMITDDARLLARKDADVRAIMQNMNGEQGIQKFRTLRPGEAFLNETQAAGGKDLVDASIKEINDRFMEKYGVKLFDDNIQTIMPKYIRASENAIRVAHTRAAYEALGLSGPLLERALLQLNPDAAKELLKLQAQKDRLVARQSVKLSNGAVIRRDGLKRASAEFEKRAIQLRAELRQVDNDLAKLEKAVKKTSEKVVDTIDRLKAAKNSVRSWQRQVRILKGDARTQALKELRAAEKEVRTLTGTMRDLRKNVPEELKVMESAPVDPQKTIIKELSPSQRQIETLKVQRTALNKQIEGIKTSLKEVTAEQQKTLIATDRSVTRSLELAKARAKQLNADVAAAHTAADAAVNAHIVAQADAVVQKDMLNKALTQLQTEIEALQKLPRVTPKQGVTLRTAGELKTKFDTLVQLITAQPPNPNFSKGMQAIAGLEVAAAKSDMEAMLMYDQIGLLDDMIRITKDQKYFKKIVNDVVIPGSKQVGENYQMTDWLFDATTVEHAIKDIGRAGLAFEKYMGLFRAYTTMRPGFHVRNAYTALFNMYLEGGVESFNGIKKWHQFYNMVQKNPENYMVLAERKFGAETAAQLDDALQVMYGSGAGHVAAMTPENTLAKGGFNPFDQNNKAINWSRGVGSKVEDHVRGAHAFAVLERGGTKDLAADVVAKWHFNYSDLGSWDRMAKNIVPFWTFFSRNLSLQAQTYVRNIPRYNRAVGTFERNMSLDSEDPTVVPQYFTKSGAIRISGGNQPRYLFTELPMAVFPNQVSQLTSISQFPEMLGNLSPLVKVPMEAIAGKSLYTGIPTADKYVPAPFGIRQALSVFGDMIPGEVVVDTPQGPVMKASWAQALNGLVPGFGQMGRLFPVSEGSGGTLESAITGFTGISTRALDEKALQGEMLRRKEAARSARSYTRSLNKYNG